MKTQFHLYLESLMFGFVILFSISFIKMCILFSFWFLLSIISYVTLFLLSFAYLFWNNAQNIFQITVFSFLRSYLEDRLSLGKYSSQPITLATAGYHFQSLITTMDRLSIHLHAHGFPKLIVAPGKKPIHDSKECTSGYDLEVMIAITSPRLLS